MKKLSQSSIPLLSVLLILCFSYALCMQNRTCNPQDFITLQKINAALGISNPPGDCCSWEFVTCDSHRPFPVTRLIYLGYPGISGQIPAAVADLKSLSHLYFLYLPNLTGNIPPSITKLPLLSNIFISSTGLSGPIPAFLANVKTLSVLQLTDNVLTGSIPSELTQSPKLYTLDLSGNKLTGTIPESFGHFKSANFKALSLAKNFLTGTVPKSLGNLNLEAIDLAGNHFSGDPSFLFGKNKTNLQVLYLSNNTFSFDLSNVTIPPNLGELIVKNNNLSFNLSNVEFPPNLFEIDLSHNNIFGSLPAQLTQLSLVYIGVSNNQLCGEIPHGGELQSMGIDSYADNKCLCGSPLPACK